MGRTLATATQIIAVEQREFADFFRTLRKADQLAFEELFAHARRHTAAIAMASHALPFEAILLAMLLEECKKCNRLSEQIGDLQRTIGALQRTLEQLTSSNEP